MPILYHYCDANALMSIVEKNFIWLSSLRSMNDTGELEFFRAVAIPAVRRRIADHRPEDGFQFHASVESAEYYAACFSTQSDDLYQWQAYGQKGKGFAVGFDSDALCPYSPHGFELSKIGYVQAPMRNAGPTLGISRVKYSTVQEIRKYAEIVAELVLDNEYAGQIGIHSIVNVINVLSAVIKNSKFTAENEFRLLYAPTISHPQNGESAAEISGALTQRKWRSGAHGITPYFEYGSVTPAIREIVLGPNCPEKDGAHLLDFLYSHGLTTVKIVNSEATLR